MCLCGFVAKTSMHHQLITTSDGSHTLHIPELGENYHSTHGAIQESKHVFIEAGLKQFAAAEKINIFEVGLGTGLNAFLTFLETSGTKKQIDYTSIEAFPIKQELAEQLNYVGQLNAAEHKNVFDSIHSSEWERQIALSSHFNFRKHQLTLQQIELPSNHFDLIYFDAFGPPVQPEMWTEAIFSKIYEATKNGGLVTTYCAKGEVKRTLKKVGFRVESLPGPPGKREMIRAHKTV